MTRNALINRIEIWQSEVEEAQHELRTLEYRVVKPDDYHERRRALLATLERLKNEGQQLKQETQAKHLVEFGDSSLV